MTDDTPINDTTRLRLLLQVLQDQIEREQYDTALGIIARMLDELPAQAL